MQEHLGLAGRVALYRLDRDMSDEELVEWFVPVTEWGEDGLYHLVKPAKCSDREKQHRQVLATHNTLTLAGINNILNNLSVPSQGGLNQESGLQPFGQILSVGNGPLNTSATGAGIARNAYDVSGNGFATGSRKVPAAFTIVGFSVTITTNFFAGDAIGTWTNGGLYGAATPFGGVFINATTTAALGSLMTWFPISYVKGSSPYALAYTFTLSN